MNAVFDWGSLLQMAIKVLPAVAQGIVAVLHFTGADRHRTIAGDLAGALQKAGDAATTLHSFLDGVAPPDMVKNPPT